MSDKSDRETSGGKRFGCLLYSACFVAVIGLVTTLIYLIWYGGARSELDVEIARIREAGEPLWFSDLAPKDRPLNLEDDATPVFMIALESRQRGPQGFYDLISADPPNPPGDYPVLATTLEANRESLDKLREAVAKPYFRLPLEFDTKTPFMVTLEPVQNSREFARLLQGEVIQSLGTGDTDRAVDAVHTMLGLSELFRDEPILITQLVRIAIGIVAVDSLTRILAASDLTPEQLARLDERLATIERTFSLKLAILGERGMCLTTMEHISENASFLSDSATGGGVEILGLRMFRPNQMADEAFMLRTLSAIAANVDEPGKKGRDAAQLYDETIRNAPKRYILGRLLMPAVTTCRQAGIRYRQKLRIARLGMRVDRFHATHGRLPESLDQVLDPQLPKLEGDLYNDLPLAYKRDSSGFLIYALADNGVDDSADKQRDSVEHQSRFEVRYSNSPPDTTQRP